MSLSTLKTVQFPALYQRTVTSKIKILRYDTEQFDTHVPRNLLPPSSGQTSLCLVTMEATYSSETVATQLTCTRHHNLKNRIHTTSLFHKRTALTHTFLQQSPFNGPSNLGHHLWSCSATKAMTSSYKESRSLNYEAGINTLCEPDIQIPRNTVYHTVTKSLASFVK